eukprot:COSAG02_NODE_496_length_21109_cov_5.047025_1_plen_80_part_00
MVMSIFALISVHTGLAGTNSEHLRAGHGLAPLGAARPASPCIAVPSAALAAAAPAAAAAAATEAPEFFVVAWVGCSAWH